MACCSGARRDCRRRFTGASDDDPIGIATPKRLTDTLLKARSVSGRSLRLLACSPALAFVFIHMNRVGFPSTSLSTSIWSIAAPPPLSRASNHLAWRASSDNLIFEPYIPHTSPRRLVMYRTMMLALLQALKESPCLRARLRFLFMRRWRAAL